MSSIGLSKANIAQAHGLMSRRNGVNRPSGAGNEIRLLRRRRLAERTGLPARPRSKDKHIKHHPFVPILRYEAFYQRYSPNIMPILRDFALPKATNALEFPSSTDDAFFIVFLASKDPQTGKPWCPDVVAALPTLESTFTGADKPQAAFIEVGQRPEYVCWDFLTRGIFAEFMCADGKTLRTCTGLSGKCTTRRLCCGLRRRARESRRLGG